MIVARTAPHDGLGADYTRLLSKPAAIVGIGVGLAITALVSGWWVGPLALAAALGAAAVVRIADRAFEGISGDLLGAVEQVGECLVLIVVTGLALHHQPWWT
jgi:adenosylcobinamide-GDP ribazoletransferase